MSIDWALAAFIGEMISIALFFLLTWLLWAGDAYRWITVPAYRNHWGLTKLFPRRFPKRPLRPHPEAPGPPLNELPAKTPITMPWENENGDE